MQEHILLLVISSKKSKYGRDMDEQTSHRRELAGRKDKARDRMGRGGREKERAIVENPRGKGEAITLGHEGPLIRLLRALPSWPDPPVEPPQHRPPLFSPFPNESRYRGHQAYKSVGTTMVNNLFPRLFLSRARSNYICHVHELLGEGSEGGWMEEARKWCVDGDPWNLK